MALHLARGRTGPLVSSQRRRGAEAIAFVLVWIAAGYLLPITSDGYLLLGIPLTAAFQLLVRRRPLRELFAPATSSPAWDGRLLALAAALALLPCRSRSDPPRWRLSTRRSTLPAACRCPRQPPSPPS